MNSNSFHVVTSFNFEGYKLYGKNFIESFSSKDVPLFIGTEDDINLFPKKSGVTFFNLKKDLSSKLWEGMVSKLPSGLRDSYQFHAHKFCYKVQALNKNDILPKEGYRVWIDGDVIFKKIITSKDLLKISNSADLSYLGRKDMWHSECGFIIFKLNDFGKHFLHRWYWYFFSGRIGLLTEWHDSYVFDIVRREFNSYNANNISEAISGINVWEKSILNEYMTHLKGNIKFKFKND